MKALVALAIGLLLAGCATSTKPTENPMRAFFTDPPDTVMPSKGFLPYSGHTRVVLLSVSDYHREKDRLKSQGYAPLGGSQFQGARPVRVDEVRAFGAEIGADVVLWVTQEAGSQETIVPVVTSVGGGTSVTNSYGSVSSSGAGAYGSATMNSQYMGTSTTTHPVSIGVQPVKTSVRVYSHAISFWRKADQ